METLLEVQNVNVTSMETPHVGLPKQGFTYALAASHGLNTQPVACNTRALPTKSQQTLPQIAYLDSGSEKHLTHSLNLLSNCSTCQLSKIQGIVPGAVVLGSGTQGDIAIVDSALVLKGVEHIPLSTENLVSIWKLLCEKLDVFFDHETMTAYIGKTVNGEFEVKARANGVNGLFQLVLDSPDIQNHLDNNTTLKALLGSHFPGPVLLRTWHERFMHAGIDQILKTVPMVHGLKISGPIPKEFFCETCILAKMPQMPYNKSGWIEGGSILDTAIIDNWFPEQDNPSLEGFKGL
ncbi:hypothetical protein HDU99_006261, partial [Rhizoclosmatium hyalinum]